MLYTQAVLSGGPGELGDQTSDQDVGKICMGYPWDWHNSKFEFF